MGIKKEFGCAYLLLWWYKSSESYRHSIGGEIRNLIPFPPNTNQIVFQREKRKKKTHIKLNIYVKDFFFIS